MKRQCGFKQAKWWYTFIKIRDRDTKDVIRLQGLWWGYKGKSTGDISHVTGEKEGFNPQKCGCNGIEWDTYNGDKQPS
jgi:hypothetical protein